jgi:hypothetical protein
MVYEVLAGFFLALSHLSDAEFFLAAGMAGFGVVAVAVMRALHAAGTAREESVQHDVAA